MNLISGLLDDVAYNVARKVENVALYEEGRVFYRQADQTRPREVEHVAGALTGEFALGNWHESSSKVDFFVTKGIVEFLLKSLGIEKVRFIKAVEHDDMHPGRTADIYLGEQFIGFVGEVHPTICEEYGIKRTYVFEIDLQQVIETPKHEERYQPISKYPAITRDVALAVDQSVENAEITNCFYDHGGKYLQSVQLFDVYQGSKLSSNKKSLAYKLTYQAQDTTLSDEQVNLDFERVLQRVEEKFAAVVR
jgi:phenylalanyl-tRNA synthetase beta chain